MSTKQLPINALAPGKREHVVRGMTILKDGTATDKMKDQGLEALSKDLGEAVGLMTKFKSEYEESAKILHTLQKDAEARKEMDGETKATIAKQAENLADVMAKLQATEEAVELFKKQMDQPLYGTDKELAQKDREAAIMLQKRAFMFKGGEEAEFKADMDNLVNPADYRSAVSKLMRVGLETKAEARRRLNEAERKAFEAASLDSGFFSPEMLGMEVDCEIECASLLDLYEQVSVSRSTFMFPHVESYGEIGQYDCDAKCDAEYGPEGNITWKNGNTYDFRGVFCFQRDTLREANYDLLGFMMRAAARTYRINRNQALITGDGVNEPLGWLTADCFTKLQTPAPNPDHRDLRQFLASAPVEYGDVTAVMHQNIFAYFASKVDSAGRFIFGDGLMGFSPSDVRDRIRISNCLPDATEGLTKGSEGSPFTSGDFIMAAGVWPRAYAAVNHRPMFMEQYEGGSTAWCVKYQFGAKDGGFVACCPAARTLVAGAAPV
jgi:HK97 family phage major capsid protein